VGREPAVGPGVADSTQAARRRAHDRGIAWGWPADDLGYPTASGRRDGMSIREFAKDELTRAGGRPADDDVIAAVRDGATTSRIAARLGGAGNGYALRRLGRLEMAERVRRSQKYAGVGIFW